MEYMTFSEKKDKSYKSYSMELAGRTLTIDIGRVAAQANGAALMHYGDTTVLCTATASEKPRDGIDFFPLSVEYEEKLYSVGKIPGGFNKREGKASENAILTSRVIDRPMRPLFPKDYRNDVTLNNMVMSVDPQCRPELAPYRHYTLGAPRLGDALEPGAPVRLGMVDARHSTVDLDGAAAEIGILPPQTQHLADAQPCRQGDHHAYIRRRGSFGQICQQFAVVSNRQ